MSIARWRSWAFGLLLGVALAQAEVPGDAVWIDVRTPREYAGGHVDQALSIPYDGIEAGVAGLKLAKDTPIYVYCAVGGRAEIARQRLSALGYSRVINVGGLDDARRLLAPPAN
jgi:phage shock protein E